MFFTILKLNRPPAVNLPLPRPAGRARRSQAERCFQEPQPPLSDKEWKKNGAGMMRVAMWQVRIDLTTLGL